MAYKTLHEQYEATADAIRTKRGTTAKISPQDFPNEIMQISTVGAQFDKYTLDDGDSVVYNSVSTQSRKVAVGHCVYIVATAATNARAALTFNNSKTIDLEAGGALILYHQTTNQWSCRFYAMDIFESFTVSGSDISLKFSADSSVQATLYCTTV